MAFAQFPVGPYVEVHGSDIHVLCPGFSHGQFYDILRMDDHDKPCVLIAVVCFAARFSAWASSLFPHKIEQCGHTLDADN